MAKLVKAVRERNPASAPSFPWKKVLLVAGAAVGAFFVYRLVKGRK